MCSYAQFSDPFVFAFTVHLQDKMRGTADRIPMIQTIIGFSHIGTLQTIRCKQLNPATRWACNFILFTNAAVVQHSQLTRLVLSFVWLAAMYSVNVPLHPAGASELYLPSNFQIQLATQITEAQQHLVGPRHRL